MGVDAKYIATISDPSDYQGASTPYEGVPVWFSNFDEYQGKYSEYKTPVNTGGKWLQSIKW